MDFKNEKWLITAVNEDTYAFDSKDNVRAYNREFLLTDETSCITSIHGVNVPNMSAVIGASGGCTIVHRNSGVVLDNRFYLAIGDQVCCLALPSLEMEWHSVVDTATCFGVYHSRKQNCLLSHGECEIVRLTIDGEVVWSASGKDIFTEGFRVHDGYVEAVDFNHEAYNIDIENGKTTIVPNRTPR